jgi:hypothetical protein
MRFDHTKEQCVSVYVRRGDKHTEMTLIEDETVFFNLAKKLWDKLPDTGTQTPVMFIGKYLTLLPITLLPSYTILPTLSYPHSSLIPSSLLPLPLPPPLLPLTSLPLTLLPPPSYLTLIGSEDPKVIESAKRWGVASHWNVRYSNLFDRNNVSAFLNMDKQIELRKKSKLSHDEWEYFSMVKPTYSTLKYILNPHIYLLNPL